MLMGLVSTEPITLSTCFNLIYNSWAFAPRYLIILLATSTSSPTICLTDHDGQTIVLFAKGIE
jgi:hypothetical protein